MKLILYSWGCNTDNILKKNLLRLGHEVFVYSRKCDHYTRDLTFAQELINLIHECDALGVISYDYFPIISMVCKTTGIRYYSWVYDSPHYTLFAKAASYECNRIGCFDGELSERLNGLGIDTVIHLPLGVEWPDLSAACDDRYACDVSFVGSLYTGDHDYYDSCLKDAELKRKADECVRKQCFEYEKDHIGGFLRDDTGNPDTPLINEIKDILDANGLILGDEYIEDIEYIFNSSFLEKKVTVEERRRLLNSVAGIGCDFRLYTGSKLSDEPLLEKYGKGYVDYHKVMPQVFNKSRINLNITLRSIKTGIPLRALDIMGCGGFLLSNYQRELDEYFENGKEMVLFYSLEDCIEKISYYLAHEDERSKIAMAGSKAVRERFDHIKQLETLLDITDGFKSVREYKSRI